MINVCNVITTPNKLSICQYLIEKYCLVLLADLCYMFSQ